MRLNQLFKVLSFLAILMVLGHLFTPHSHAQPNRSIFFTHESHTFFEKCLEIFSIDLGEQHLNVYRADAASPDVYIPIDTDYRTILSSIIWQVKIANSPTALHPKAWNENKRLKPTELSPEVRRGPPQA